MIRITSGAAAAVTLLAAGCGSMGETPKSEAAAKSGSGLTFFVTSRGSGKGGTSAASRAPTGIASRSPRRWAPAITPGAPISARRARAR